MPKQKNLWIVVADGMRARFFTLNQERPGLAPAGVPDMLAAEVHGRAQDLKSDRPGRTFSSASAGARHAVEPRHDYHKSAKHKFSADLAALLEDARRKKQYGELVLVAPRRSLGELRGLLSRGVKASLRHEVPKDLTKHTTAGLWRQLSPFVRGPGTFSTD
jgi:protein required for attachment to host cells